MNSVYVLNPDIALPMVINKADVNKYAIPFDVPYPSVQHRLDKAQPGFHNRLSALKYSGMVYSALSDQMKPFLELVNWKQPEARKPVDEPVVVITVGKIKVIQPEIPYRAPRLILDSISWQKLSSIGKQYYLPIEQIYKERYKITDFYADLAIPPRGTYGTLHYDKRAKNIKVNGQTSIIPANCSRILVRLRDGSLLELYHLNYNPDEHVKEVQLLYAILSKLVALEPMLSKRYFFSLVLTNELLRPAYMFSLLLKKGILEL